MSESTFSLEGSLPSLPVPSLETTLASYLDSVRPLVSEVQYERTREIVARFRRGNGACLHKTFVDDVGNARNWLEKMWEDEAYLKPRYPIFPYVNFGGPCTLDSLGMDQCVMAGLYAHAMLDYWQRAKDGRLPITRNRRTPWCMKQLGDMFNSCRIPRRGCDELVRHFRPSSIGGACPSHMVVVCRARFYSIAIQHDGHILSATALVRCMRHILQHASTQPPALDVCSMTCADRDTWADARAYIAELGDNAAHLRTIETAVNMIVLTDEQPVTDEHLAQFALASDSRHQWADKTLVNHVHANGRVSLSSDHSNVDAIVVVQSGHHCREYLEARHMRVAECGDASLDVPVTPRELVFHADDHLLSVAAEARRLARINTADVDCRIRFFEEYGQAEFRRNGVYGDTVVQMAMQLAHYRMHGKPASVYETASTRQFHHGRTETMRSTTVESTRFVRCDRNSPDRGRLLASAMQRHNSLMAEASDGQGCDRHLLALRTIAKREDSPTDELFTDASWTAAGGDGTFTVSSSFVGYSTMYGGVVAMNKDGHGVFYRIAKDAITFTLTAWKSSAISELGRFEMHLWQALRELQPLIQTTSAKM